VLKTLRLILREPAGDDAPALSAYYRRNAARFSRWEPARADDVEVQRAWIDERQRARRADHATGFLVFEAAGGALTGVVTLDGFSERPRGAMLSYSIDASCEGRGYASEAVACTIAYAFDVLGLDVLTAYYHPGNARSGRLLERQGFRIIARTDPVPGFEALMRPQVVAERTRAASGLPAADV
jgi:ribosomal-protein-alanine N-acetyltransferase